jgi:hypothetical protein
MLFPVHWFMSPWWLRRYVPPKHRFLQEKHGVTSQKTAFFIVTAVTTPKSYTIYIFCLPHTWCLIICFQHFIIFFLLHTEQRCQEELNYVTKRTYKQKKMPWEKNISSGIAFEMTLHSNILHSSHCIVTGTSRYKPIIKQEVYILFQCNDTTTCKPLELTWN